MEVILETKYNKENSVIQKIKSKFTKIKKIERCKEFRKDSYYILVTYDDEHLPSDTDVKKLETKYKKLPNVVTVTVNRPITSIENIATKNCHFIFDVDSTLTTGNETIQNKVRDIFHDMNKDGHRIYLASGRTMENLRQNMQDFNTENYGIAENGGIILGFGHEGYLLIGDRTEPDKVLQYMKMKYRNIREDIDQGMRITERIFIADIKELKFKNYVKKSKAKVDILASKNSYHVTKERINKGYALEKLRVKLRLGSNDIVIGVGDSDLDIPLLRESDYSFVVGNASRKAKNVAVSLNNNYADGVREMYENYFKKI